MGNGQSIHPTEDKPFAHPVVHDGHVTKGFADGYVSIKEHGGKEKKICYTKKICKEKVGMHKHYRE